MGWVAQVRSEKCRVGDIRYSRWERDSTEYSRGYCYASNSIGQTQVRQVPHHQTQRRCSRHLFHTETFPAARLTGRSRNNSGVSPIFPRKDPRRLLMVRIAGVDVPDRKRASIALRTIYGIGPKNSLDILVRAGIDANIPPRMNELNEAQVDRIREIVDKEYTTEGDLRREVSQNIRRLIEIGSYRGTRHRRGLPVHGQRTRTNARTRKGPRRTVAGRGRRTGAKK